MSDYQVYISPSALKEMKNLPGHIRQRIGRTINTLANEPRPFQSIKLDLQKLDLANLAIEPRRIRIEQWRIIYAITEAEKLIDVLAVRKRPPYDYDDIENLLAELL